VSEEVSEGALVVLISTYRADVEGLIERDTAAQGVANLALAHLLAIHKEGSRTTYIDKWKRVEDRGE